MRHHPSRSPRRLPHAARADPGETIPEPEATWQHEIEPGAPGGEAGTNLSQREEGGRREETKGMCTAPPTGQPRARGGAEGDRSDAGRTGRDAFTA